MLFPTVQFALFFPVVLSLSWALMSPPVLWKPFIVVASYAFYASASWRFCLLPAGVTLGNQAAAVLIDRTDVERDRRRILRSPSGLIWSRSRSSSTTGSSSRTSGSAWIGLDWGCRFRC